MLQKIRDGRRGILGIIVIGAVIVVMAFFGMGSFLTPDADPAIAKVNGTEISQRDYQRRYQQFLGGERQRLGERFNVQLYEAPVFQRQFLDNLIDESLLIETLSRSGLTIANADLRDTIQGAPGFQVDGQFSPEVYQIYLSSLGETTTQFEERLRRDLLLQQLPRLVGGSSIATSAEAERAAELQNQQRSFAYSLLSSEGFLDGIDVGDEDIQARYDGSPLGFMESEKVTVNYIEFKLDDLASQVTVNEQDLLARYEARKQQLLNAERRLTSHILLELADDANDEQTAQALAQAQTLIERALGGEDFAELAKEFSQDPGSGRQGGDLDWVEKGMMVAPFEEALFALEEGAISEPVRSSFGYHVIQLRDIQAEELQSYEQAKGELEIELKQELAEQGFDELESQLSQLAFEKSGSLDALAELLATPVQTSEAFAASGGAGVAVYPEVTQAAFSPEVLQDRRNSDAILVAPRHAVYLRINEYQEPQRKPLNTVRESIVAEIKAEQAAKALTERGEALLAKLQLGVDLTEAAAEYELEVKAAEKVGRFGGDIPPALNRLVFGLPHPQPDQVNAHLVDFGGGKAVVQLTAVVDGEESDAGQESMLARISRARASAEISALVASLRSGADIIVNEQAFQNN